MKCYIGEVHAHTCESDGKGTPAEAYDYARNVGKVDYFSPTDHDFGLKVDRFYQLMPPLADEKNEDGAFAAMFGFEMSYNAATGYYGHANIIMPKSIAFTPDYYLDEWYAHLAETGETGVGQFNHPGDKWGNFNDFKYDPRVGDIFRLMELRITEYGIPVIEEEYENCLHKGWHISPVSNEDTHAANWTTAREETGAVLAESLTRENILDGMRHNRTYATTDRTLKLFYRANGEWLGSRLKKTGKLDIEIEASTEKECGLGVLQLVGEHNRVLAQKDFKSKKSGRWTLTLPDDQKYTYLKRINAMQYAITAPVWVEQPEITDLSLVSTYQNGKLCATLTVANKSGADLTDLTVEWYPACGSIEKNVKPAGISFLDPIKAGNKAVAGYTSPIRPADTRLVAVVKGKIDGEEFTSSTLIRLSPVVISQLFPTGPSFAAMGYTQQPFCCFDLTNRTDAEIDLGAYLFRIYNGSGRHQEFRVPRKLAPHGILTVWMKGTASNTIEDFNRYYRTTLGEEELYCAGEIYTPTRNISKLTVAVGDETVCRAWVRADGYHKITVPKLSAFRYNWQENTSTLKVTEMRVDAMPQERFRLAPAPLTMPEGKALATFTQKKAKIRSVALLCDGGEDPAALEARAAGYFPGAEVRAFVLDHVGQKRNFGKFFFDEGENVLNEIADGKFDTVLLSVGANECVSSPDTFFTFNFCSYSTALAALARPFRVRGMNVFATMPVIPEEGKNREQMLLHSLYMSTRSNEIGLVGVPEEVTPDYRCLDKKVIVPREGAIKIACVGDQYSEGQLGVLPYATLLQEMFGDRAEVRIYAKNVAKAANGSAYYFRDYAPEQMDDLRQFAPDYIVPWFAEADMKVSYAETWDTDYKARFIGGYLDLLSIFAETGAKLLLVGPFDRFVDDICKKVMTMPGGQVDTIREICEKTGAAYLDLLTPTREDHSLLLEGPRQTQALSRAGAEMLAKMVYDYIEKN